MFDKTNPFLKSPEEIDLELEANLRAIDSNLGKNRPRNYEIQDEVFKISLMDRDNYYPDGVNEPGTTFSLNSLL
jgi:hypothetical protein